MRLAHHDFEAFQIHLAESPCTDAGIGLETVGLLVVSGEMLCTYANAAALDTIHISGRNFSSKERVF